MLMLFCTVCGYAVGPLAAWCVSQQTWLTCLGSKSAQFGRKVNHELLNVEMLFSRGQTHRQSGEWPGGREPDYLRPNLLIFFMHLKVTGLAQILVTSFALDVRG